MVEGLLHLTTRTRDLVIWKTALASPSDSYFIVGNSGQDSPKLLTTTSLQKLRSKRMASRSCVEKFCSI